MIDQILGITIFLTGQITVLIFMELMNRMGEDKGE